MRRDDGDSGDVITDTDIPIFIIAEAPTGEAVEHEQDRVCLAAFGHDVDMVTDEECVLSVGKRQQFGMAKLFGQGDDFGAMRADAGFLAKRRKVGNRDVDLAQGNQLISVKQAGGNVGGARAGLPLSHEVRFLD